MGAISQKSAEFLLRSRLADAEAGDVDALFELGLTYSTGRGGIAVDLSKRINGSTFPRYPGCTRGQECRAEIACEMTASEIAEAQRQARAWLGTTIISAAPPDYWTRMVTARGSAPRRSSEPTATAFPCPSW